MSLHDKPNINMKPNSTSINQYLPLDKQVYKYNIDSICKRLNVSIRDLDRNVDSKLLADTWLLILKEQLLAQKELETESVQEEKTSWSREEIVKLCMDAMLYSHMNLPGNLTPIQGMNKWIEENL